MPQCCAVPFCSEKKGGHQFPKDKNLSKQWLEAIRKNNYTPSKHWRVCKKHFNPDDYELPVESFTENLPKCTNDGGHTFPRESDLLQKWLRAIRRESFTPKRSSRICRDHFTDNDYEMPKASVIDYPLPRLKKNAVPSIFPWTTGKIKATASNSQTQNGTMENSNQTAIKSHEFTNYRFKDKPPVRRQTPNNDLRLNVIPFAMPKSQINIPAKITPVIKKKKKELKMISLKLKPPQRDSLISVMNDKDLVIRDKACKYLSRKLKPPSLVKVPVISERDPLFIKPPPTLHPDETMIPTMSMLETLSFINAEDDLMKIKQEPPDEEMDCKETLHNSVEVEISPVFKKSVPIQCNLCQCFKHDQKLKDQNENPKNKFCIENVMDVSNPAEVQFFTGFKDYEQFKYIFDLLGDDVNHLKYYLSKKNAQAHSLKPFDEFLLTVIKLRRNKSFTELGFKFRTSTEVARIICTTWINFLFRKFKELASWMPEDDINKYMRFAKKRCNVIIHCQGIQLQRKKNTYGERTTLNPDKSLKVLVEMSESGDSKFVSEVLSGSLTDFELIRKCTEARSNENSNLEIENQVRQPIISRKIMGLSKLYSILNGKLHHMLVPLANQVVFVCFMLTNFLKRL